MSKMSGSALNFSKILNRLMLFIGIGVAVHILILLSTTESKTLTLLYKISFWHIVAILICMILPWFGTATRMLIWSKFLNEKISFIEAVRVVITSEVVSAVSPTAVGGTPIRAAMLVNRGFQNGNIGFILTYSIVEDLIFYATGFFIAIFVAGDTLIQARNGLVGFFPTYGVYMMGLIVLVVVLLRWIIQRKAIQKHAFRSRWVKIQLKIKDTLTDMYQNFNLAFKDGKLSILLSLLVLFCQWAAKLTILVILFDAFNVDLSVGTIYIKQWLTYVMMLFVPTPGASGGAEASFLLMFRKSVPQDISFFILSLWRLFTYYFILLLAVSFYLVLTYVFGIKENVIVD